MTSVRSFVRLVAVACLSMVARSAWSQPYTLSLSPASNFATAGGRVQSLPTQGQLPVAMVHCILQDTEGFMWYGTQGGGLCRDNGYQVDVFRTYEGAPLGDILCMAEDKRGGIWFGTPRGLFRLNKDDYTLSQPAAEPASAKTHRVDALLCDATGTIWFSRGATVTRISPDGAQTDVPLRGGNTPRSVWQLYEDSQGTVFAVCGGDGIWRCAEDDKAFVRIPCELPSTVSCMLEAPGGTGYWVGTTTSGVLLLNSQDYSITPQLSTQQERSRLHVIDMCVDSANELLWTVTDFDLHVYHYGSDGLEALPSLLPASWPNYKILDHLCYDRHGSVWVSGFTPHTFIVSPTDEQVQRISVPSMHEWTGFPLLADRMVADGEAYWIWQGRVGLCHWEPSTDRLERVSGGYDRSICAAPQGGLYAASGPVLWHLRMDGQSVERTQIGTAGSSIRRIVPSTTDDLLYVATSGGVEVCEGDELRTLFATAGAVTDLVAAPNGSLYFIVSGKGLYRGVPAVSRGQRSPSPSSFTLEPLDTLLSEELTALCLAPDGVLWACGEEGGVYSYDPAGGQQCLVRNVRMSRPPTDALIDIVSDALGHVWVLANQYATEFNPRTGAFRLLRNTDARIDVSYFYSFEPLDGRHIGLAGAGAYCVVTSAAELDASTDVGSAPVVTAVQVGDSMHLMGRAEQGLTLRADAPSMRVFCTTFEPLVADRITFAYRVPGWLDEWVYLPQGQNSFPLHNLPVGRHTVCIRATDVNGFWLEGEGTLSVRRLPHWWQTWQAWVGLLLLIVAMGWLLWWVNKRIHFLLRLQKRQQQLKLDEIQLAPDQLWGKQIDDDFLRRAIRLVEENIANSEYSVEQFSSDLCMSHMNAYRKLRALTGLAPSDFIRDIRLKAAARLVQQHPDISVAQLAREVGFKSPSYFTKCFKAKFGVLPKQYGL